MLWTYESLFFVFKLYWGQEKNQRVDDEQKKMLFWMTEFLLSNNGFTKSACVLMKEAKILIQDSFYMIILLSDWQWCRATGYWENFPLLSEKGESDDLEAISVDSLFASVFHDFSVLMTLFYYSAETAT